VKRHAPASAWAAAIAVAGAGALAACTLILPFDEVPAPEDGGADVASPRLDGQTDAGADAASDAPGDAPRDVDLDALASCKGKTGTFCGNNQLVDYPYPDDLVVCDGGKVAAAKPCTTGTKCQHLVNPHPDQCDECTSKTDGYYCGREFAGWIKTGTNNNAQIRVHCRSGGIDRIDYCATTCSIPSAGAAVCD
jgi:hypothetical protein